MRRCRQLTGACTVNAVFDLADGPLVVKVKEHSEGPFYWVVTRLTVLEFTAGINVNASDHPHPTHEAALLGG